MRLILRKDFELLLKQLIEFHDRSLLYTVIEKKPMCKSKDVAIPV